MALKKTLTIAGSDTSAGAGMQADLKTFQELDTYGMVALTSIVTMDKETWSHDVTPIPFDVFEKQLETAISIGPDAVKTGMLGTQEVIKRAGEAFEHLLPKATITTPNLFEAGQLAGLGTLKSIEDMKHAAEIIHDKGAQHVIIKGGKALDQDKSYDLYYDGDKFYQLTTDMFQQSYNHGAGCTFAAATTAYLANGKNPKDAVIAAKAFVASAIKNGWKMNDFVGPVDHGAYNRIEHIDVDVQEV